MNGIIYKISNDINNKIYIGKTLETIEKRFAQHLKDAKKRKIEKRPLYNAINKYGANHFKIEKIEECSIEQLSEREQYWIEKLDTYKNGYNATIGGDGKQLFNYQAILSGFENGKILSELAEEFGCDISTIHKILLKAGINNTRKNCLIKQKREYGKSVECWNIKTNELINTFDSYGLAIEWLIKNGYTNTKDKNKITGNIGRVVNGKRKTAYGFKWISK